MANLNPKSTVDAMDHCLGEILIEASDSPIRALFGENGIDSTTIFIQLSDQDISDMSYTITDSSGTTAYKLSIPERNKLKTLRECYNAIPQRTRMSWL